jgi:hypothetical protein
VATIACELSVADARTALRGGRLERARQDGAADGTDAVGEDQGDGLAHCSGLM